MAMNDFNIGFLAGLDGTKSKAKLNQDIDAIKKSLNELELKAKLDPNQVKALENQLNSLKVNLNNVSIDKASLDNLVSQINNSLSGIKLQIPNLNTGNIGNQAQQTGQQIGQQIQNGINSVIQKGSFEKIFRASGNGINNVSKDAEKYFKTLSNTVSVQERLGNNNNLTSFTVSLKNAEGVAEQLNYQLRKITDDKGNIIDRYFEYSGGSINDNGVIKQLNTISTKADSLQTKLEKLKSSYSDMNASRPIKDSNNISALSQQYDKVAKSIENVRNADSASFSSMVSNAQREITVLENMVSQFRNAENVATQMKSVDISSGIAQAQERLGKLKANASGFDQMKQTIVNLDNAIAKVGDKSSLDNFINQLKTAETQLSRVKAETRNMATEQQRLSLANTIEAWNQKNTAATKSVRAENDRYVASLRDLNTQMTKIDFNKINNGFKQNENSMRTINRLGASLKDQMKQAANSFTQWISVSSAIMGVVYSTKQAVSELKEVDTLLTEISKANDQLSKTQLKQIGYNSFDVSGKYGKKATDYLSGVQEASRAGYVNAEGIAELSVAAQGAGDMTAELANQYIIATDKAYKLGGSVEKLTEVLDGSNYITNHNAVNMTELAEGMSIVGSQASSLGVGVDQTTAALGTMIATTQQSGSEMARAFKAILLNIQQVSDEEEGIDAEGLTKYEKACNALNVSLKETKNGVMSLRDPMEVIKDLSEEYTKLDANDIRRTNLLSSVGGKVLPRYTEMCN